jgi:hypothetical protein
MMSANNSNADEPIPNVVITPKDRSRDFLPTPLTPSQVVDADVYAAWKKHIIVGFEQNNEMFKKVLDAFIRPYWLTVNMYRVLFAVGILGFVAAVVLGVTQGFQFAAIFGGLSVAAFLTFFVSQPLRALERNLHFITWLGVIYNTYWTRLMYANDNATIQKDLDEITKTTIAELEQVIDKHTELSGKAIEVPKL